MTRTQRRLPPKEAFIQCKVQGRLKLIVSLGEKKCENYMAVLDEVAAAIAGCTVTTKVAAVALRDDILKR